MKPAPEVDNTRIAGLFRQVADVLEVEEENAFRIRAYRNAARVVENLPRQVVAMLAAGEDLTELPGIGKDLAGKMAEIVHTGRLGLLEKLRHGREAGLAELLGVPDLGPKRVRLLIDSLGVRSLAGLRQAARRGRLADLPGFGERLQERVLRHLRLPGGPASGRLPWRQADALATPLLRHLRGLRGLRALEVAGSYRRRRETVGDLDILVAADDPEAAIRRFLDYPGRAETMAQGPTRAALRLKDGFQVDLRAVPLESFGAALVYFTGSKEHNVLLRSRARRLGLKVNEYGVYRGARRLAGATEQEVYQVLDLAWVPPERREASDGLKAK